MNSCCWIFWQMNILWINYLVDIELFKFNNKSDRTMFEICSKLIKTPEDVIIVPLLFWCFHCWFWISKCHLGDTLWIKNYQSCITFWHVLKKNRQLKQSIEMILWLKYFVKDCTQQTFLVIQDVFKTSATCVCKTFYIVDKKLSKLHYLVSCIKNTSLLKTKY